MSEPRVFLLSPARCDGARARMLMNPASTNTLAVSLRASNGAELGETFSFLSALYFRGKLAYARAFGGVASPSTFVITTDRGLVPPETRITREDLVAFGSVNIGTTSQRYVAPLRRDVSALAERVDAGTPVVLLGSIATGKYTDVLLDAFGDRLVFPGDFVGRGDMSRGGLLLRHAREGRELDYIKVAGAVRHGKRPPKLERIR